MVERAFGIRIRVLADGKITSYLSITILHGYNEGSLCDVSVRKNAFNNVMELCNEVERVALNNFDATIKFGIDSARLFRDAQ